MNTLLGRKMYQTQGFLEDGSRIPVTAIMASDNTVVAIKTLERDKYSAVKVGFGKTTKTTKPLLGELKVANITSAPLVMQEMRLDDTSGLELGMTFKVEDVFKPGDLVDIIGTSKGKGFAGGVKRYGFAGGPKTHGQSDRHRAPGSIGSGTTPGRVYRGKRMAGNMGRETVTIQNLSVVDVNAELKTLYIKGLVPGIINGIVKITKVGELKAKNFSPLYKINNTETPTTETPETTEIIEDVTVAEPVAAAPEAPVEVSEPEVLRQAQDVEQPAESVAEVVEEVKTEDKEQNA